MKKNSFKIGILGLPNAQAFLFSFVDKSTNAAGYAVYQMAQDVLAASRKIVPRDTGDLNRSAYVTKPVQKFNGVVSCEVGYNTKYAFWVHEIPDPPVKHVKPKGAQYKYLSTPYEQYKFSKMFKKYVTKGMKQNKQVPKSSIGNVP